MALPATDAFTGADANPIGGNWTTAPNAGAVQRLSNAAKGAADNAVAYWNADAFDGDHYSSCKSALSGAGGSSGPALRIQTGGGSNQGYVLTLESSTSQKFYRNDNNSYTQIGSTMNGGISSSTVCKLEANGTSITFYADGSPVGSPATDATYSGGSAGLFFFNSSQDALDDWEGGNVSAGGTDYPYTGAGSSIWDSGTVRSRTVVRDGSGSSVWESGSTYSYTQGGNDYAYTGAGTSVWAAGTDRSRGIVRDGAGSSVWESGSTYSPAKSLSYVGGGVSVWAAGTDRSRSIVRDGAGASIWAASTDRTRGVVRDGAGVAVWGTGSTYSKGGAGTDYPYTGAGVSIWSAYTAYWNTPDGVALHGQNKHGTFKHADGKTTNMGEEGVPPQ